MDDAYSIVRLKPWGWGGGWSKVNKMSQLAMGAFKDSSFLFRRNNDWSTDVAKGGTVKR